MGYTIAMQGFIDRQYKTLFVIGGGILVSVAFYSGFLQGKQSNDVEPVTLSCKDNVLDKLSIPLEKISSGVVAHAESKIPETKGKFVGSKNSTKYYAPSCAAVKRIKPENYQWFDTAEDATMQGYTPGKC
ncbi:MAG: hypothetical protein JWL92_567 [Candidatus Nomurabacteria bacterium]|nr:hypothetical protein [Candidatus Nomurabacteria bacterium]